ncbi:hypothetical protein [Streptomyces sp. AHA2]|uniref:hypothetical protein n=1 Tax=Streptomyces sp. AHA2 TaxID=3064526 RepID=UPI002FE0E431
MRRCKARPDVCSRRGPASAAYLYVGAYGDEHEPEVPLAGRGRCPAGRLNSRLFYRGTIDRYQALPLDEEPATRLVDLYRPRAGDLPADAIAPSRLEEFLHRNTGRHLLPQDFDPEAAGGGARWEPSAGTAPEVGR